MKKPRETKYSEQTAWMLAVRERRDKVAFGQLFDYFAPRLKGMAVRSGLVGTAADDLVQDVMLTVWHKASQFDPHRAHVAAWVFQIARNRRVDIARKDTWPIPEEVEAVAGVEDDASQIVALEQEAKRLRTALSRLKPDQRQMVEKAYLGELTHREISEQTGLALGTVKSRIKLGLDRLRHELRGLR